MNNSLAWRYNLKTFETFLCPPQQSKSLPVPFKFHFLVNLSRVFSSEIICLQRMINHKLNWHDWIYLINFLLIALFYRFSHRNKIHHSWNPSKILQQNSSRVEGNFLIGTFTPIYYLFNVFLFNNNSVFVAQEIFE